VFELLEYLQNTGQNAQLIDKVEMDGNAQEQQQSQLKWQ